MTTRPVLLWGPPASGKSTAGAMLAHASRAPFVDVDVHVAREAAEDIPAIFAGEGEAGFRARERAVIVRALEDPRAVIAAGGGALVDAAFRREVLRRAHVITLDAPREVLAARIGAQPGARPLLAGDDADARLDALLEARREAYAEAHARIAGDAEPETVLHRTREALEALRRGDVRVVPLGARSYRVTVGPAESLGVEIRGLAPSSVVWVTDARVMRRVGGPAHFGVIDPPAAKLALRGRGEADKTLASVRAIWDAALARGIDRDALLVAAGGGVVTDLTGFAAATLLRGVRYASAPTTLLAMVDASVGGKTGFDHRAGKNLLGAFHQPSAVVCDPRALESLTQRARRAGLAEIAKIALACDAGLLAALERDADALHGASIASLAPHIAPAIQAKIDVVVRDERESGERALLNFGHTIGHALEQGSRYAMPHGECVALGMRAALNLGVLSGLTPAVHAARALALLDALGLPAAPTAPVNRAVAVRALGSDKKRRGGELRFVTLFARYGERVLRTFRLERPQRFLHGLAMRSAAARNALWIGATLLAVAAVWQARAALRRPRPRYA
ncbi:MAG: bifunctional shikimate kinase/3-dehydroquinate synthase [Deltaproteobacteria bacterium]